MWPLKKKPKKPEQEIGNELPKPNIELRVTFDPVTMRVFMKPKEPESQPEPQQEPKAAPEPEQERTTQVPPMDTKWECPTCKQAFPPRTTKSRFKCPHCRNWIYFLDDDKLVTEEYKENYYRERNKEYEREEKRMARDEAKSVRETSKEELKRYAGQEFVVGVEILCDTDACDVCKRFEGKKYYFKDGHVPLIPLAGCKHERCLCTYAPFVEET